MHEYNYALYSYHKTSGRVRFTEIPVKAEVINKFHAYTYWKLKLILQILDDKQHVIYFYKLKLFACSFSGRRSRLADN